jgi:hypothetical protein
MFVIPKGVQLPALVMTYEIVLNNYVNRHVGEGMSYQLKVCQRDIITPEGRNVTLVHKHLCIPTTYNLKFIPNYP